MRSDPTQIIEKVFNFWFHFIEALLLTAALSIAADISIDKVGFESNFLLSLASGISFLLLNFYLFAYSLRFASFVGLHNHKNPFPYIAVALFSMLFAWGGLQVLLSILHPLILGSI